MILFYFLSSMLIVSFPTEAAYTGHNCSTLAGNSTSTFKSNLNQLLSTLSSNANRNNTAGFYNATVGTAYGLFLCRGDVSARVCEECVANATSEALLRCPDNQQAVVWYDNCTLRYSNQPFYSEAATSPELETWSERNLTQYVTEPADLDDELITTLDNLVPKAANASYNFPTEAAYTGGYCSTLAGTSTFKSNLHQLLSTLSSNANRSDTAGFYNATVGTAYGLFLCRRDVSARICKECVANATSKALLRCPDSQQAVVWYDYCMLRYSNQPFHSEAATSPDWVLYSTENLTEYMEEPAELNDVLVMTLDNLVPKAANASDKFATEEATFTPNVISFTVYSLGQCTQDLSATDCNACLRKGATRLVPSKQGGRVLYPSCNVRFEMYSFYQEVTSTTKQSLAPEPSLPPPPALPRWLPPPPSAPPSTRPGEE
ncbi:putative cysteine-rich receptor-like protein kinase 9 [Prunus avium]|uniref:Cysteine-rich receptor-like protein kinase 9 n=2 Tax=Prunus avium TaxID=42229 RepID=A0A6P5SK73_PRUAV|nr:putative cysteine-rich receptor-like protein kinase 9 [Prunus avium]